MQVPVDRHCLALLPALRRRHVAAQISRNFLPRIQTVFGSLGWPCTNGWFAHRALLIEPQSSAWGTELYVRSPAEARQKAAFHGKSEDCRTSAPYRLKLPDGIFDRAPGQYQISGSHFMKSKTIGWTVRIVAILALAVGTLALAEDSAPKELRGEINAYSPQTTKVVNGITTATGPYEVRGSWSLKLKRDGSKADFSAALNMEFSDGWVLTPTGGNGNFDPSVRGAHTHHITMTDGEVTRLSNGGFQVYGPAAVTLNGGATPFAQTSFVTIVITGSGADAMPGIDPIEFSNITVAFGAPANGHFGMVPLVGVVRSVSRER
jgi:hypothetical protein